MKHLIFLLIILLEISGCKTINRVDFVGGKNEKATLIKEKADAHFYFDKVRIRTESDSNHLFGFTVYYDIQDNLHTGTIIQLIDSGQGFISEIKLSKNGQNVLPDSFKNSESFSDFSDWKGSFFIPYHVLNCASGIQNLKLKFAGFIAIIDSNPDGKSKYKKASSFEDASCEISLDINIPAKKKGKIELTSFTLNDAVMAPSDWDYHFLGSGYPDLFYKLYVGNQIIATCKADHNLLKWNHNELTNDLYFTSKDTFDLMIYDFDDFSHNDLVGELLFSPNALCNERKPQSFNFGNIKDCMLNCIEVRN